MKKIKVIFIWFVAFLLTIAFVLIIGTIGERNRDKYRDSPIEVIPVQSDSNVNRI